MLQILEFIFSSFWTWSGTVVLVAVFGQGIGLSIWALRAPLRSKE